MAQSEKRRLGGTILPQQSAPTNPPSSHATLYVGTDGEFHWRTPAGTDQPFLLGQSPVYVTHGATAGTARPNVGTRPVVWRGSVQPTNWTAVDIWEDTTGGGGGAATAPLVLTSPLATDITLTLKGAASQSADLTQWHDSAGVVQSYITSAGLARFGRNSAAAAMFEQDAGGALTIRGTAGTAGGVLTITPNSGNESLLSGTNIRISPSNLLTLEGNFMSVSAGPGIGHAVLELRTSNGTGFYQEGGNSNRRITVGNGVTATLAAQFAVQNAAAAQIAQIVKGAASQTANLTEWQDSTGAVLAKVSSNGGLSANGLSIPNGFGIANTAGGPFFSASLTGWTVINTGGVANIPFRVQGEAGQTGNLQEWRNSAGTVLAAATSNGTVGRVPGTADQAVLTVDGGYSALLLGSRTVLRGLTDGPMLMVQNAADFGLRIRAAASQTANLQEWQDSTGAVLASVTATGIITAQTPTAASHVATKGYVDGLGGGGVTFGTPVTQNPDVANTAGVATSASRSDHIHNIPAGAAVGLTFASASAEGTATDFARSDHTHAITAFDATAPSQVTATAAAAAGSATVAARRDHIHNISTAAPSANLTELTTNAVGSAASLARSDHSHGITGFLPLTGGTLTGALTMVSSAAASIPVIVKGAASQTADLVQWQDSASSVLARVTAAGVFQVGTNAVWHAGNDGAGSGLDADTLDGVQLADVVQSTTVDFVVKLTAAAYAALGTKDANTLYVIVG